MKAVVLVGGLTSTMRPMTLTLPLPLLPFVNKPLVMHQLQAGRGAQAVADLQAATRGCAGL